MKSRVSWIVGGGFTSSDYMLSNWMQLSGFRNLSRALELRIVPRNVADSLPNSKRHGPGIGLGRLNGGSGQWAALCGPSGMYESRVLRVIL